MAEQLDPSLYYRTSDLPDAAAITGEELVEATQNGKSVKFTLSQLIVAAPSNYELAIEHGFTGTYEEWAALQIGPKGDDGTDGEDGVDGKSALEQLQEAYPEANLTTPEDMAAFLKGDDGKDSLTQFQEAYPEEDLSDMAKLTEFLRGPKGDDGASAFDIAVELGFEGTKEEWLEEQKASLTTDDLQVLLNQKGYTVKDVLRLTGTGAFIGNSAFLNFLFLYDKRMNNENPGSASLTVPQMKGEMGRMEAEKYSYWKNSSANATKGGPRLPEVPDSEMRLFDSGLVQFGSLTDFIELGDGSKLRVVKDDVVKEYNLDSMGGGGTGTRIVGYVDSVEELPDVTEAEELGHAYFVVTNLYVPLNGVWEDFGDFSGPAGIGINIRGTLTTENQLPITNNLNGDAFIISSKKIMMVWDGTNWSEVGQVGPAGDDNYTLAVKHGFDGTYEEWAEENKGAQGEKGDTGDKGDKGDPANAIRVLGRFDVPEELPLSAEPGDAYYIARNLFVWNGDEWFDAGELYAKSAFDLAVERGFPGDIDDWLQSLVGEQGEKGEKGDTGEAGPTGPGLRMLGELDNPEELPQEAEQLGDAYLIAEHSWVYGTNGWFDAGLFRGPQGIQGERGFTGDKGDTGAGLKIYGEVASIGELPEPTEENPIELGTAYTLAGTRNVLIFGIHGWYNAGELRGADGPAGPRGFQGIQGIPGVRGLQGPRGVIGPRGEQGLRGFDGPIGPTGKELVISGRKAQPSLLPEGAAIGTAYVIQDADTLEDRVWIFGVDGWFDSGILQGPKGDKGDDGLKGDTGIQGPVGEALNLQGKKDTVEELPGDALFGESWLVNGFIYFKTNAGFVNLGELRGEPGIQGERGIQGIQGIQGFQGRGLRVLGEKANISLLPNEGNAYGDGYKVGTNLWIYGVQGWFDAGVMTAVSAYDTYAQIALETGVNPLSEEDWIASLKGEKGERGDSGASIYVKGRKTSVGELPLEGNAVNDAWVVNQNVYVWTEAGDWEDCGVIAGPRGDVGPQGLTGRQGIQGLRGLKGETGRSLLLGDYDPNAADGNIGDVFMNNLTQGVWLKATNLIWNFIGYFGGGNVYKPADANKTYVWKNGWVEFNRYDLNAQTTTGVCDVSLSNVFLLNATTTGTKTVSFTNLPTGRATTVVVLVSGNTGNVVWPSNIQWANGEAPTMSPTMTNVVFLYDGTRLIGSVGASA